jgi:hypothetical protein
LRVGSALKIPHADGGRNDARGADWGRFEEACVEPGLSVGAPYDDSLRAGEFQNGTGNPSTRYCGVECSGNSVDDPVAKGVRCLLWGEPGGSPMAGALPRAVIAVELERLAEGWRGRLRGDFFP